MDHAARDAGNYYSERNLSPQKGRPAPPRSTMASLCSWRHAHGFANLMKAMVGSGLLTLPWATAQVGLIVSLIGLPIIAWMAQHAIRLVVRRAIWEQAQRPGYAGLVEAGESSASAEQHGSGLWQLVTTAAVGALDRRFTPLSLLTAQLGVGSAYIDFVASSLRGFAPGHLTLGSSMGWPRGVEPRARTPSNHL